MMESYNRILRSISVPKEFKGERVFLRLSSGDEKGYLASIPVMERLKRVGADCYAIFSEDSKVVRLLETVWEILDGKGDDDQRFLSLVNDAFARSGEKPFSKFVAKPTLLFQHKDGVFHGRGVEIEAEGAEEWAASMDEKPIEEACRKMLESGFNMQRGEDFAQIVTILPLEPKLPKRDYLAAYVEALVLQRVARSFGGEATTLFLNFKPDPNLPVDPHFASLIIFWALEHEKEIDEPIFQAYRELSTEMRLSKISVPPTVWFGFIGEGYVGKDVFGEVVGYPTPNRETRWQGGFQLIRKHEWYPQFEKDGRKPLLRFAITETIPTETFSTTINVDYDVLKTRCAKIRDIVNGSDEVTVTGKPIEGTQMDIKVQVGQRKMRVDDGIVNMQPETNYGNFPAGEAFITPEAVHGIFVADEVVVIDKSYLLEHPLVVEMKGNRYKVRKASPEILEVIERERAKAWKRIETWEAKGVPKEIVELNKRNFMNIGEFAIGVNPNARVSRYLIEAEKIDRTVHMALGSGYDPDRPTTYHWDAVAGWRQKLTVTAIRKGERKPILQEGLWKI